MDQKEIGAKEWSNIQGSVLEQPEFDWLFREDISYADSCKEGLRKVQNLLVIPSELKIKH